MNMSPTFKQFIKELKVIPVDVQLDMNRI